MILVISSKKVYAAKRLELEANSRKLEVKIMDMADLVARDFKIDVAKFDVLYIRDPYLKGNPKYIPQIIKLAKKFKLAGKKVVDSVIANGDLGRGKWVDYQKLMSAGLPIPRTNLLSGYRLNTKSYPLILKWVYGFKAKNVFLINNQAELKAVLPLHPKKELLVQEFVRAEYEYKVITMGHKALPVVLRFKILDSGFRTDFDKYDVLRSPPLLLRRGSGRGCSNSSLNTTSLPPKADKNSGTLGGISPHHLDELGMTLSDSRMGQEGRTLDALISLAESASRSLGRELAKVDILEAEGKFYILEVNRFPGLQSFENLTNFNVTKDFLAYIIAKS